MHAASTANERFKRSSRSSFWIALTVATLLHAAAFAGSPVFALDPAAGPDGPELRVLPAEARIPEPPPPIQPPAAPKISDVAPGHVTLDPVTPEVWKRRPLDPPPAGGAAEAGIPFTPMEVAPRLLNTVEVRRALERHYPPVLRDAGIGGTVSVWFHIDAAGRVVETRVHRSSGYDDLDRAALAVAGVMEFSPALNRDRRVPVWVSIDVLFEVR